MRFSIEEINNSSTLLPNVTLGYEMFDTCSASANVYGTLRVLSQCTEPYIKMQNNFTKYKTKAIAFIGPDSSDFAFITASILGMFLVPQISYEATNELLSIKRICPSFLRTIPSDKLQVEVMLLLLKKFNWTWIAIVASDNDYGRQGLQKLYALAVKKGICVAYQGIIPSIVTGPEIKHMVGNITQAKVNVVVVFSTKRLAKVFFQEIIQENITNKVWVGSEDWSVAPLIFNIPNIHQIGSVLGVSVRQSKLPGLMDFEAAYVSSVKVNYVYPCDTCNGCNQICQECQTFTMNNMSIPSQFDTFASFNVYSAVHAIAYGLHELLNCSSGECSKDIFYPWQLLEKVKNVSFTLHNQSISFDDKGDPFTGYDIVMWERKEENLSFNIIGSFSQNPRILEINEDMLKWFTLDNQVPVSVCSKECGKGDRRVQTGFHKCCFYCVACPRMTFSNASDLYACQQCGLKQWSPPRSEMCHNRSLEYLSWTDPVSVVLLVIITLLLIITIAIAVVFTLNLNTPVVKSAGGKMCLVMLMSLACSCCTLYCYFGKPHKVTCMIRQPLLQ
ncbi:hypothetical protein FKM82_013618 [Ascaphus truei]